MVSLERCAYISKKVIIDDRTFFIEMHINPLSLNGAITRYMSAAALPQ